MDDTPFSEFFADGFAEPAPPPLTTAPSQAELFARLRLARSRRVGPVTFQRLLAEHKTAEAALSALPDLAEAAGMRGYAPADESAVRSEIRAARKARARLLAWGAPGYPGRLAEIGSAPPILWAQGDMSLATARCVALVGTRNASSLALRMTRALGRDLADAGVTVISGMARGVDAAAHEAALPRTLAIHAGGLDRPYPPDNAALAARVAAEGGALSERPFGHTPRAQDFPRRNRIVSGLAQIVVVVEAAARSGSMITARDALDQGREVMAVPGHPMDGRASGCNLLLRDGASLVRGVDDILAVLDTLGAPHLPGLERHPPPDSADLVPIPQPEGLKAAVLGFLGNVPTPEDQLCRDAGCAPATLATLLSELELAGEIARRPGGGVVRV